MGVGDPMVDNVEAAWGSATKGFGWGSTGRRLNERDKEGAQEALICERALRLKRRLGVGPAVDGRCCAESEVR